MRERTSNSGVVAEGQIEGAERQLPPLNFSLPEHFLLFGKFSSKIQIVGLKMPHMGELRGKIEISSTHKLLCRKFVLHLSTFRQRLKTDLFAESFS